ncbi:CrcB-like protein-domain-containing protein [Mrakia frigida]|uniref:FluC/FEX family fluoride channel n=1 Tax=Mrakia frigida TaxID=29902 RepID=UPI003FCC2242
MHPTPPLRRDSLSNEELTVGRQDREEEEGSTRAQHSNSSPPASRSSPSSNMDQPYDDGSNTPPEEPIPTKDPLPETTPPPINPFTHLPTFSLLVLFSILGCLARIGLTALFTYQGQAVFPLIWSQGLGCLLMGFCVGWRKDLERWGGRELYFGLGTGLCGSITTFSSWMLQTFEAFSNFPGSTQRSGVHDAADGITHLVLTVSFAFFSFHLGRHLSSNHFPSLSPSRSPLLTHPLLTKTITILLPLLLYLALLLICILDHKTDRTLLLSVLLAPPGTLLRFHLTRLNPVFGSKPHKRTKGIPTLGTFTANMLATAILGTSYVLQRKPLPGGALSTLQCQVLQAVEDGFCGSLSTVSTFVVEIDDMRGRRGAGYLAGSWVMGVLIMVAIVGGSWWNGSGFGEACRL